MEFKKVSDKLDFFRKVGLIYGFQFPKLEYLKIYPCTPLGDFSRQRLDELVEFCKKNPRFHIISSYRATHYFNHISPWATFFELGMGNKDPTLCFFSRRTVEQYHRDLIFVLTRDERCTNPGELRTIIKLVRDF